MPWNNVRYAGVASVLALTACGGVGGIGGTDDPSASFTTGGSTYKITVTDDGLSTESKYMGAAPAGTKYWSATTELRGLHGDETPISPPALSIGVPVALTQVTPPGRGGLANLPTAGSCTLNGLPGVLSGKGNNGLDDRETAGIADGLCLFTMVYDAGDDKATASYVTNGGFTGGDLGNVTYFVAPADMTGATHGDWTTLTS